MWRYSYPTELYHYGILGMKWGVRRYQKKDGTLTEAGKKRAAKLQKEYSELTNHSIRTKSSSKSAATKEEPKKKSISEMSDKELNDVINRIALEKRYVEAIRSANPQKVSRGKRLVDEFKDRAVTSISQNAANAVGEVLKKAMVNSLSKAIGVDMNAGNNQNQNQNQQKKQNN